MNQTQNRSFLMRSVRQQDTAPELALRRFLHAKGFRYRLHARDEPGTPDLLLPRRATAIFVHGCFWHGHDCSHGAATSKTNAAFWSAKIATNRERDARKRRELETRGWHVEVVWECQLQDRALLERLARRLARRGAFVARRPDVSAARGSPPAPEHAPP
ncbi:MAG TPA: very short patch repair endonuclease, partial [Burkholderiaceae bacterium]|nr:very short patch repair endonuclease [Burkholderiaceae bacterium]